MGASWTKAFFCNYASLAKCPMAKTRLLLLTRWRPRPTFGLLGWSPVEERYQLAYGHLTQFVTSASHSHNCELRVSFRSGDKWLMSERTYNSQIKYPDITVVLSNILLLTCTVCPMYCSSWKQSSIFKPRLKTKHGQTVLFTGGPWFGIRYFNDTKSHACRAVRKFRAQLFVSFFLFQVKI